MAHGIINSSYICKTCGSPDREHRVEFTGKFGVGHVCPLAKTKSGTLARPDLAEYINSLPNKDGQ